MTSNNKILQIYKARRTILEILETKLNYNIFEYATFSINEIDAMYTNDQLDMLLKEKKGTKKIYIKFNLNVKQMRPQILENIKEELFETNMLEKSDDIIIISEEEVNEGIRSKLNEMYSSEGVLMNIISLRRLQINVYEHVLVPSMIKLRVEEIEEIGLDVEKLPEISRYDITAMLQCVRPLEVCKIVRKSETGLEHVYYRRCVQ